MKWPSGSRATSWLFVITSVFTQGLELVHAQVNVNGQIYTNGLSIVNSPALNSVFQAGSTLPISIEVSGNGKIPQLALTPGSGLETSYEALEIYLVSLQTQLNITVSKGPELLVNETGSVKHLDWPVPFCVPTGQYNITLYESSRYDGQDYFSITPIPVAINNNAPQGTCPQGYNEIEPQPQPSSPPPRPPYLPGTMLPSSSVNPGTSMTRISSASSGTTTPSVSSVTLTLVSTVTVVTTQFGLPITTTITTTATTTVATPTDSGLEPGFFPVNSSYRVENGPLGVVLTLIIGIFTLLWM